MNIIPVIDLLDGKVVHAKRGDRKNYQPINSPLCTSSDPMHITQSLIELYPFKELYIADLNSIQRNGHHYDTIKTINRRFPHIELWLDSGFSEVSDLYEWHDLPIKFVIGTESLRSMDNYLAIKRVYQHQLILSLDFTPTGYKGPPELLEDSSSWPEKVIAMTLNHVGSGLGPDMKKLNEILSASTHSAIYAAGGVRDATDISTLTSMGIQGALIASALHSGDLSAKQLEAVFANQ
ncbi:hypothetical protein A7981_05465 [Methylovorus sp. MM2]|uniref:HisA/HisF-related TIM barrel protein n=1 Tax=Methylovorus sp. MM2 TaxID=1848038 RepID=UPI0007E191CC|nr:HisA/HisF-related TIM barrel protein [Methylovorus sp. MM2]OAM52887.1 hypothetical protein A7981_05465 [Methylovorus sp. MM2]